MSKRTRKRQELRAHLERRIDRAMFPDYVLTESDLAACIAHESTGMEPGQKARYINLWLERNPQ